MNPTVDVHIDDGWFERSLRADVRAGLTTSPKSLPPKWFYDKLGSDLFAEITRLPEYYPTRAEREVFVTRADDIARITAADTLIELGAGVADKTRVLLAAFDAHRGLDRFIPFDVSEATLRETAQSVAAENPGLDVHAVVGDFDAHLPLIPRGGRRLVAFLGGTIGNYEPVARARLFADVAAVCGPGGWLLLGTDLVKDTARLEAAYNDAQGVTIRFNKNVLSVLNAQLGADFDLDTFEHHARFDTENEWMDIGLRSTVEQDITLSEWDMSVHFAAGELMRTEISAKFRREGTRNRTPAGGARTATVLDRCRR